MIIVYGDNCVDRYVRPIQRDFVGGNAANVAAQLAGLGAEVAYVGIIGNDPEGAIVHRAFSERGVDCSRIVSRNGSTSVSRIEVRDGERIILEDLVGVQCPLYLQSEQLEWFLRAALVHCTAFTSWNASFYEVCPAILEEVEYLYRAGIPVSMDFSELDEPELARRVGRFLRVAFVSRGPFCSAEMLTRTFQFFHGCGVSEVIVTLGPAGAAYSDGALAFHTPAKPIVPVDTLGAGDAFIAGWILGFTRGEGPEARMQRATDIAAAACLHFGGWPDEALTTGGLRMKGTEITSLCKTQ